MAKSPMGQSVRREAPQTEPKQDLGCDCGRQLSLELRDYQDWREVIYAALQRAVDQGFSKLSDFADEVGKSTSEVSLRLRRAEDGKGDPQKAPLDYLATLARRPGALEDFLADLAAEKGFRLEPVRPLTADEKVRILAGELSDDARRRLERDNRLPKGSLDR